MKRQTFPSNDTKLYSSEDVSASDLIAAIQSAGIAAVNSIRAAGEAGRSWPSQIPETFSGTHHSDMAEEVRSSVWHTGSPHAGHGAIGSGNGVFPHLENDPASVAPIDTETSSGPAQNGAPASIGTSFQQAEIVPSGGSLDLSAPFTGRVSFGGDTGTLKIDHSADFSGTVTGQLTTGDVIDFSDITAGANAAISYSGNNSPGVLTVSDGSHTAHVALTGNYSLANFTVSSDGHGGTSVVDPPVSGDGSVGAPGGTPQFANILDGYAARPAWEVAGVDYAVGIKPGTVLKDPAAIHMAGVTVDQGSHQVVVTGANVTLDGYDFSLAGGWSVVTQAANTTISDSNFKIGSNANFTIYGDTGSSNLSVMNCVIDGNMVPDRLNGGLIYTDTPGLTIEYSLLKNAYSDFIQAQGGGAVTIKYNVLNNNGNQNAHPDWVQTLGDASDPFTETITYNTVYQTVVPNSDGTQGFMLNDNGAVLSSAELAYNTIVAVPGAQVGVVTTVNGGAQLTGTALIHDNFADTRGGSYGNESFFADPSYTANAKYYNNTNMETGGIYYQNVSSGPAAAVQENSSKAVATNASLVPSVSIDSESVNGTTVTLQGHASSGVWVGGATVQIFDGTKAIGTVDADSNGAWTFTTGSLSGGSHTLTAEANNFFGYASAPASKTAAISGAAPPPSGAGSSGTGVTGPGAAGSDSTGSGSSGTGPTGTGPAVPAAPIIASFSPDSGVVGDHITNVKAFALTGSAAANSTVHVFDGNTQIGSVATNSSGAWTFTAPSLSDGSHNLHATATNSAGSSATSSTYAVTVDTVAPVAPVETAASIVNGNEVKVGGTAEAHSTIKVYDGTSLAATATADATGAWNATTTTLSTGTHSLAAIATDAAGNVSGLSHALDATISAVPTSTGGQTGSAGTPQLPDLLSGYAVRPTWQVAGVDYAVGVQAGTALKDPSVAGNLPPGVSLDSVNHVVNVHGNNVTLSGFDFSLHGGWTVDIQSGTTGTTTIQNCNFSLNANQPIAINASSTDVGNLTVLNCSFDGNQMNIPSVLPPPAGTGLGAAINYGGTGNFVAKYNYIHDMPADGIDLGDGTVTPTIEYNLFKGLGYTPGSHPDPVQFVGDVVNNATIGYNTIYQPQGVEPNEGLAVQAQLGSTITNTTIANNVIIATGPNMSMSLNIGLFQDAGNVLKGVTVANNYVDPTGTFTSTGFGDMPSEVQGSNLTISHNVNLLTGQATAPTAGTYSTASVPNLPFEGPAAAAGGSSTGGTSSPPPQGGNIVPPAAPVISSDTVAGAKVQVAGTAEAGSTVDLYDGSTHLGTTHAGSDGHWTLTTSNLSQGIHDFVASATDAAGNTSGFSQPVEAVIGSTSAGQPSSPPPADTTAPDAPVMVSDTVLQDKVQVLGTAEVGSTVTLYEGSVLLGSTHAGSDGHWSVTTPSLTAGAHTFVATATDAAGNTSGFSEGLDPVIGSSSPGASTGSQQASEMQFTDVHQGRHGTVILSGTSDPNGHIKLYDGAKAVGTTTADEDGNWSFTSPASANTSHAFSAKEIESNGHTVASTNGQVILGSHNNDTLVSTSGDDTFVGKGGADTFVFAANFGHDVITDFIASGRGHDTVNFSKTVFDSFASVLAHASQAGTDVVISSGSDTLTLKNTKVGALDSHDFHFG